ncbi:MAG: SCO6880 family protein [Bifidobacterium breve]|nr:SCO6880 family protein [Bifidobacterium breve]
MASNTTYGDWMRPMPGGIRNIGIPLTIAGMGVLTCTLLVSMASVVAAIAILVVGMGVILVLAIRDREHRNMVDRAVEKRTWMAAQRTGANLYRSGLLAPIDGGKAMLPGILSRVVLTSALDGLGREFCLVRHAHTGEYSLLLSCQPQGASLADDDVEDSYVASWAGLMESLASETGVTQLAVTVDTAPDSGVRFRRTLSKRIVEDAPELAARAMAQIMDQYAAGGASNDVTLTLTFRYTDRDGKYLEAGEAARRISLLLPSIREQIAQAGGGAARALGMEEITRMVRVAYDPAAQETIEESDEPPYIAWEDCGPLMHEAGWSHYSHDSGLSRTWEMVDPPQSNVTADTLTRQNRQKAANQVSQEKRATVRSMSQIGKANRQAVETNQGAVMVFFGMLVTVTVSRGEQESQRLEAASRAVEQAAGGAKIDLRPCYGAQDTGFAASLPLGLNVRSYTPAGPLGRLLS